MSTWELRENKHKETQVLWWGWIKPACCKGTRRVLSWLPIGTWKTLTYLWGSLLRCWSGFMDLAFQLSPIQSPVCTEETSVLEGWEIVGCFGCNWIVLKQLRICTTEDAEDKASSHCTPLVSFAVVAQRTAKQRHWIQLTSPVCEPQSGRDSGDLRRTTEYQMLHLTVLGILTHLSSTKNRRCMCVEGGVWHLPAPLLLPPCSERNVLTTSKIIISWGRKPPASLPAPVQGLISESLNRLRTGTVIRTMLQHFSVVSQVPLQYPVEALFLSKWNSH